MPAFVTSAALTAALNAAAAAPPFAKDPAYIDALIAAIGPNPRRRVTWGSTEVFNATVSGSLTRSGTQLIVPAVTANAIASATITTGSGVHRVENASNAGVYIESLVDEEAAGLAGRVSANIVAGQPFALSQGVLNGPGLDPTSNYVDAMLDDMRANDIVLFNAPDQDWMKGGNIVSGADMRPSALASWWPGNRFSDLSHWGALLPWYVVYDRPGHSANRNVRVRIRNLEVWVLEDSAPTTWRRIGLVVGPAGNSYARNAVQAGGNASGRRESDGSFSAKIDPDGDIYHGYGSHVTDFDPAQLRGIQVRGRFQLIPENPAGPDERHLVAYAVDVGIDAYPFAGATLSQANATYWPGNVTSRWRAVGNSEIVVTCTNVDTARNIDTSAPRNFRQVMTEAAFRAAPPPAP